MLKTNKRIKLKRKRRRFSSGKSLKGLQGFNVGLPGKESLGGGDKSLRNQI